MRQPHVACQQASVPGLDPGVCPCSAVGPFCVPTELMAFGDKAHTVMRTLISHHTTYVKDRVHPRIVEWSGPILQLWGISVHVQLRALSRSE